MSGARVVFFGGNGHCAFRLAGARRAADAIGLAIDDVAYPGFEGRPCPATFEGFLTQTARAVGDAPLVYATGIGGLVALCLRARGILRDRSLILQSPVLWGLEHRVLPRLMRLGLVRRLAAALIASPPLRTAFVRRYLRVPLAPESRRAFFDGYARCSATGPLFAWLMPSVLRDLERRFAADPTALAQIHVWWGGRDRVVTLEELRCTERAIHVRWPVSIFPDWGHYPMIDVPTEWAAAVRARVGMRSSE